MNRTSPVSPISGRRSIRRLHVRRQSSGSGPASPSTTFHRTEVHRRAPITTTVQRRSSFLHSLRERERVGVFPFPGKDKSNECRLQQYLHELQKRNGTLKARRNVLTTSLSLQKGLDACFLHSTSDMRPIPVQRKPLCLPCLAGEEPLRNGHVFLGLGWENSKFL